jgi:hypothetical protein
LSDGDIIEVMPGRSNGRRSRGWASVGVAIYAIFLLTSQFEHHDLLCELKTPQHCTACTSSVVGSDPTAPAALGAWQLADAGSAVSSQVLAADVLLSVRSTGRSPPAVC